MNKETKQCQNCKEKFVIEPEDFTFYEKIKVPPPTFCPDCRQQRRYAWRNERTLYRRDCDLCGKSTVTIYSPNKPYKVYCPKCWWGDGWDAGEFAQDFDFNRPFFDQFCELQLKVPRIALLNKNSVNSEYTNHSADIKNCYLSFATFFSEDIMYSTTVTKSKDSVDCYRMEDNNELLYEAINAYRSYKCQYVQNIRGCINCCYSFDLRNCENCFLCANLRNKQYCFLNEQYTKEDYFKKANEFNLSSYADRVKLYNEYLKLIKEKALHKYAIIEKSINCTGNLIFNSKNSLNSFEIGDAEDCKYIYVSLVTKDCMDSYHFGATACELIYETHAIVGSYNVFFTHLSYDNSHLQYCDSCHNSQSLFGCVGIRKGSYTIFNKQYSKEEYEDLVPKIIEHMKKTGEYGEFFPVSISPFGYNETQGQVYMPMTKEEALPKGFKWEDQVPGTFGKETIKPEDISDDIKDVSDSITKEVLKCIGCTKNYNIVPPELEFYRRENIPIPRLCPDCRYARRIALRPPRKLWHRKCQCLSAEALAKEDAYRNTITHFHGDKPCPNEFETSYALDRKEIVYCEKCYQQEVV